MYVTAVTAQNELCLAPPVQVVLVKLKLPSSELIMYQDSNVKGYQHSGTLCLRFMNILKQ